MPGLTKGTLLVELRLLLAEMVLAKERKDNKVGDAVAAGVAVMEHVGVVVTEHVGVVVVGVVVVGVVVVGAEGRWVVEAGDEELYTGMSYSF